MSATDRYGVLDRMLNDVAFRTVRAQRALADVEEILFREQLAAVSSENPVFITALPRSGTTILLRLLHDSGRFASHTYRDAPFLLCPLLWHRFSAIFSVEGETVERAHGDGLRVSPDSPEAFEEVIWKEFWPDHYGMDRIRPWSACEENAEFETFLESHIRKVILLREKEPPYGGRYVSKNNLNISRLAALPRPMRRGTILVPFRDPLQHAASMLRQHRRFSRLHEEDDFVRRYMEAIGHHEFGKGLMPVDFGGWLEEAPAANHVSFWVGYWVAAYRFVLGHLDRAPVRLVSYRRLTQQPEESMGRLAEVVDAPAADLTQMAGRVRPPRSHGVDRSAIPEALLADATELYAALDEKAVV